MIEFLKTFQKEKMPENWKDQMKNQVNTLKELEKYINVDSSEREAINVKNHMGNNTSFCIVNG